MQIDPGRIPFSRAGAYMALSRLGDDAPLGAGLYLRNLHGDAMREIICRIDLFTDANVLAADIETTFDALTLRSATHSLQCIFSDLQTVRCASAGIGIRLTFPLGIYDHALQRPGGWQINSFSNRRSYALTARSGAWRVIGDAEVITACAEPDSDGALDISVAEFLSEWPTANSTSKMPFVLARQQIVTELDHWRSALLTPEPTYADTHALAAYVLWSARVEPQGYLRRDTVLMSKNWMRSVWSWDHCFIAMALAHADPALAWDQFMLPFDMQNAAGALPDCMNDTAIVWNFCKPPVHGWTLRWLQRHGFTLDAARLHEIYQPLSRWTQWWLTHRDDNRSGFAHYNHGNDSGWDNATLFDAGTPLATPDLSAFLVVQMQVLAELAQKLDRADDAQRWQQHAEKLLDRLLREFWRDDHFVALRVVDGSPIFSDTLLLQMPIILGNLLPSNIREALLGTLQRFITPHGLATENPRSPHYAADSYWRGPAWAPVMFLIIESLRETGAQDLAEQLRIRFCDTVAASGMAENFDALTGRGLRDPAHTWTAAVFILLAAA